MTVKGGQRPNQIGVALFVKDAAAMAEFYKSVLNATEVRCHAMAEDGLFPKGAVTAVELQIGSLCLTVAVENPRWKEAPRSDWPRSPESAETTTVFLSLYVDDVDAVVARALALGATTLNPQKPIEDAHWGDRVAQFIDPAGHAWRIQTAKEEVAFEELPHRLELARAARSRSAGAQPT
ncbi:VOC family protein [Methylocapsa aurea]|uniref:VOC family protein n=1 Tax=Methylocapsa aurea TaxID=663610 RepID=UPI00068ACCB2|nr:VOC family protein [Methylocapsa aurea]